MKEHPGRPIPFLMPSGVFSHSTGHLAASSGESGDGKVGNQPKKLDIQEDTFPGTSLFKNKEEKIIGSAQKNPKRFVFLLEH